LDFGGSPVRHRAGEVQELLATGVLGIIKKPYEMTAVENEIRAILDRPRS